MKFLKEIQRLIQRRADLARELARVDVQLADVREALETVTELNGSLDGNRTTNRRVEMPDRTPLDHHNRDRPRTAKILKALAVQARSTKQLAELLKIDRKNAHLVLWRLKQGGHVQSIGWSRGAKWALTSRAPAAAAAKEAL